MITANENKSRNLHTNNEIVEFKGGFQSGKFPVTSFLSPSEPLYQKCHKAGEL